MSSVNNLQNRNPQFRVNESEKKETLKNLFGALSSEQPNHHAEIPSIQKNANRFSRSATTCTTIRGFFNKVARFLGITNTSKSQPIYKQKADSILQQVPHIQELIQDSYDVSNKNIS